MSTYQIQKGDNLTKIARKYGVSINDILQANSNIKDPNLIYAGQSLVIPKSITQAPVTADIPTRTVVKTTSEPAVSTQEPVVKSVAVTQTTPQTKETQSTSVYAGFPSAQQVMNGVSTLQNIGAFLKNDWNKTRELFRTDANSPRIRVNANTGSTDIKFGDPIKYIQNPNYIPKYIDYYSFKNGGSIVKPLM